MKRHIHSIVSAIVATMLLSCMPASGQDAIPPLSTIGEISPRMERLTKELANGTTTTAFWQEVSKEGTPLVESLGATAKHQLVTFLWQGSSDTRNVLVLWDPYSWVRPQDYLMRRVLQSDVWALTVRVPTGARFIYRLSINDPIDSPGLGILRPGPAVQRDPLNPNTFLRGYSAVELPGAPRQPWLSKRANVPSGTISAHRVKSEALGESRDISVYLPPGYTATRGDYPTLIMFDGSSNMSVIPVPVILDNLLADGQIPPTVALFVSHPDRMHDLTENPRFARFVVEDLLPWSRTQYRVTRRASDIVVGGQSAGCTGAAYVALHHSEAVGKVLCQSGAFWASPALIADQATRGASTNGERDHHTAMELQDRAMPEGNSLPQEFARRPRLPLAFHLDAGVFEGGFFGGPGGTAGILESNRHMRDVLRAKGYEVHYQEFVGGHDYLSWRGTLADGLIALLGKAQQHRP